MANQILVPTLIGGSLLSAVLTLTFFIPMIDEQNAIRSEIATNFLNIQRDCVTAKRWDDSISCDKE